MRKTHLLGMGSVYVCRFVPNPEGRIENACSIKEFRGGDGNFCIADYQQPCGDVHLW